MDALSGSICEIDMTIKLKLTLLCVFLAVIPALLGASISGILAYRSGHDAIATLVENQLTSIRENKRQQVEDYFSTIHDQLRTTAMSTMTLDAMRSFSAAVPLYQQQRNLDNTAIQQQRRELQRFYTNEFGPVYEQANPGASNPGLAYFNALNDLAVIFQHQFIAANPHPLGEKDSLIAPADQTDYSTIHRRFHPAFREFLVAFDYYDIFLVEPTDGVIVYSVFKELDYMTSLQRGPYARTGIAEAYRQAMQRPSEVVLIDFASYPPSYENPASFTAITIHEDGELLGVLIFQMPVDRINNMMTHGENWQASGLGDSGETYLVGSDGTLRSQSRFLLEDKTAYLDALRSAGVSAERIRLIEAKDTAIGFQPADTEGVRRALAGQSGFDIFPDYRNTPVLSSYTPLAIPGVRWVLMSEMDEVEAFAASQQLARQVLISALLLGPVILVLGVLIGTWLAIGLTRPIQQLATTLTDIEKNSDLVQRLPAKGKDEIADSERALNQMLTSFHRIISKMTEVSVSLSSASDQMARLTTLTLEGARHQEQESDQVSTAATEMAASIEEVARSAQSAATAAHDADLATRKGTEVVRKDIEGTHNLAHQIEEAVQVIRQLSEDSDKIGTVLGVIQSIAEQTNLLALNAAIEAARAGDQGRGFSVVADEVRTLAQRTQQSTHEIQTMIDQLQGNAGKAVSTMDNSYQQAQRNVETAGEAGQALDLIAQSVQTIKQMNEQIAAAAEQQLVVAETISASIVQISEIARRNAEAAGESAETAGQIEALARQVHEQASRFKT